MYIYKYICNYLSILCFSHEKTRPIKQPLPSLPWLRCLNFRTSAPTKTDTPLACIGHLIGKIKEKTIWVSLKVFIWFLSLSLREELVGQALTFFFNCDPQHANQGSKTRIHGSVRRRKQLNAHGASPHGTLQPFSTTYELHR